MDGFFNALAVVLSFTVALTVFALALFGPMILAATVSPWFSLLYLVSILLVTLELWVLKAIMREI